MLRGDRSACGGAEKRDVHTLHNAAWQANVGIVEDDDACRVRQSATEIPREIGNPFHPQRSGPADPSRHGVEKSVGALGMDANLGRDLDLTLGIQAIGLFNERHDFHECRRYYPNVLLAEQLDLHQSRAWSSNNHMEFPIRSSGQDLTARRTNHDMLFGID